MSHLDNDPPVAWMQKVAREFNQAETTFVVRSKATTSPDVAARLRSFTAGGTEVFGAGHDALGAWSWPFETDHVTRPDNSGRAASHPATGTDPPRETAPGRRPAADPASPSPTRGGSGHSAELLWDPIGGSNLPQTQRC
ncbi:PhzF family phenazine biosynthesis protein [Streptomyces sp. NPDC007856]|uniref:PhzF family phenazine biosynthesis protein n=1 Tax=Streptomyces sp. NPDC007856 TaxID=3364781 RepID=UPI0036A017C0